MGKRKALVNQKECVACGCCWKACPKGAIEIYKGIYAKINGEKCIGCGICAKACSADVIRLEEREEKENARETMV